MDRYVVVGNPVAHSQSPFIHARVRARRPAQAIDYERLLCPLDGSPRRCARSPTAAAAAATSRCRSSSRPGRSPRARSERAAPRRRAPTCCASTPTAGSADNTDGAGLVRDIERNAGVALRRRARAADRRRRRRRRRARAADRARPRASSWSPTAASSKAQALVERHLRRSARAVGVALRGRAARRLRAGFDVVVNATASSLHGRAVPVAGSVLRRGALALDMMYGAAAQPFLDWAARARRARPRRPGHAGRAGGRGVSASGAACAPQTAPVLAALRARLDAQ